MSTHALIAEGTLEHFVAAYHHFDGHPDNLGWTLLVAACGHFQHDLRVLCDYLIHSQYGQQGWSTLVDCNLALEPADQHAYPVPTASRAPVLLGGDPAGLYDQTALDDFEYLYLINPEAHTITCYDDSLEMLFEFVITPEVTPEAIQTLFAT